MMESLKTKLDFPSPVVQAQMVRNLVAAVLKEKGQNGQIAQNFSQGPALELLWQQCCSDRPLVRSACCDAVVLLVEQGHADLNYVLNSVLNLLPSARNVQGLIKVVGRLLQMQADLRDQETHFACPYSIRSNPHPYITALENRVDCWTALLVEMDEFLQRAADRNDAAYVAMLAPFLRYLYCEPQRRPQHALLRHGLFRVLLPVRSGAASTVSDSLLRCLFQLIPHMQVDSAEAVLELCGLVDALLQSLLRDSDQRWGAERAQLLLQLLCACRCCLGFGGDCRPVLSLMQQLLPACEQELPVDELITGVALLMLDAPVPQQTSLLQLALDLTHEHGPLCPWLSPVLVLPTLQLRSCSSLTEALTERRTHELNQSLIQRLLRSFSRPRGRPEWSAPVLALPLCSWYSELTVALSVLRRVADDPAEAADWLLSIHSALSASQLLPPSLTLIVTYLIITGQEDVCQLALNAGQAVAVADPCQVPSLIPVLLFKLEKEMNPGLAHAVLSCLPNLSTHKLCVPVVLQTLHVLATAPKLRAVAMRLMAALWRKQDRVYPELQHLLGQQDSRLVVAGRDVQWEQTLARAACIRDICAERPYQHAGDMLAAITLTLSQCAQPDMAVPAALALKALWELCRAEVLDIVSTWRNLRAELSRDSRPLVVRAIAELLALVPQLPVRSDEYEKLKDETAHFLWNYALSENPEVATSGYRALAEFPEPVHKMTFLPEAARPVTKRSVDEGAELKKEEEEEDLSVPGSSYVKLMSLTPISVLPAFELFLTALVRQESSQMPRGVFFSALRGGSLRSDQGKTVAGIPSFMLKTYEKNKHPGLKPGLAAGLLLCYELPPHTDRDGRPIDRFLVGRSRSYQQTLAALIHEVSIQPSEWHRALLLPQAWRGFMSRAFHAVLQGRRADLEMRQREGKEEPTGLQYELHCAWLWARDQLTNVIKAATKDSPVVQGNSILALSGLAAALAKHESGLPADGGDGSLGAGPEFVPTASWLATVLETLLSVISSSYRASGQVFPWFLHRSYSGENTASTIARSCASLALSLLVSAPGVRQTDVLGQVLQALQAGLPGSPAAAADSQAVQFHSGLALGMLLSRLYQQCFSNASAQKDAGLLTDSLDVLESCSFNPDLQHSAGCLLGLALVLAAFCRGTQKEQHARVARALDRLLVRLQDGSGQQEVLAYAVACVGVSAFSRNLVDAAKAEEVLNTLRTMTEESQQTPGFSLALGSAVHGLSTAAHGKAEDVHPRLLAAWTKILLAEGCPTMQRLAAANGLVALAGSESYIVQASQPNGDSEFTSRQQSRLNEVIRAVTQIITFSGAVGLQSNSACLLGHLHLAHVSSSHSHTTVAQDFGYLAEKSVVRAIVDFVTEAGKKGPELFHPALVRTALSALASVGTSFQYPPVNWGAVLSPVMRLGFGADVQHRCVVLAASQVQTSQSASLFLGSWLSPPFVHGLSRETRAHLYETLGLWMKHVAEDKLQVHVETLREELRRPLLQGLARAMALPDPPSSCWTVLCSTVEKIFDLLPNHVQDEVVDLYVGVAKCLSEMSDAEIEEVTRVTEPRMEKCCFVLACLTSRGRVPLLGLNDVIAGVLRGWPSRRVGWILLQSFYQCRLATSAVAGVSNRMEWLLELMGHMRNVAYGSKSVTCGDTKRATDFLFQVFAAAVISWADHATPLLLGVGAQLLPWQRGAEHALPRCLLGIPRSLALLLNKEPWSRQADKFIDWLFSIAEGPEQSLSTTTVSAARVALSALKSSAEFRKKAVWTRASGW